MYIGLTGYMGSGKGEVAKILGGIGFKYISLSDMVRQKASDQQLLHTRENLQRVGNNLRLKDGAGVLGKLVRQKLEQDLYQDWIIDGIRNPVEILELRKLNNFNMLGLRVDSDLLVDRIMSRNRSGDSLTRDDILAKLDKESGVNEPPEGQQVEKCLQNIDFLIMNNGELSEINSKIQHFIKLSKGEERLSFDEVFMEISYTWAKRTTCLRRAVGAVIAKDSQQLTAGYNGAPRGIKHCAEVGGCMREKLKIPSGQRHEMCRGTHAEQNAITQAAKFGINIAGSTLYCNTFPCVICTKLIINAGIKKVVYDSDYDDKLSKQLLGEQTQLEIVRYEGKIFSV